MQLMLQSIRISTFQVVIHHYNLLTVWLSSIVILFMSGNRSKSMIHPKFFQNNWKTCPVNSSDRTKLCTQVSPLTPLTHGRVNGLTLSIFNVLCSGMFSHRIYDREELIQDVYTASSRCCFNNIQKLFINNAKTMLRNNYYIVIEFTVY